MENKIVENVKLGKNVKIYNFTNIYGCEIGDNTKIGSYVEIRECVKIRKELTKYKAIEKELEEFKQLSSWEFDGHGKAPSDSKNFTAEKIGPGGHQFYKQHIEPIHNEVGKLVDEKKKYGLREGCKVACIFCKSCGSSASCICTCITCSRCRV